MSSNVPNQIRGHILLSRWVGGPVHWLWWYEYDQINPIRIRWRSINRPICCICPHLEHGHLQTMHNISTQHDCMCRRQNVAFYGICPDSNKSRTCCLPYSILMSFAQMLSVLPRSHFQSADMKKLRFPVFVLSCSKQILVWRRLQSEIRSSACFVEPNSSIVCSESLLAFVHTCVLSHEKKISRDFTRY